MIVIQSQGKTYNLFDSITVDVSLDNLVDTFSFSTTLKDDMPLKKGMVINMNIDNVSRLKGVIERAELKVSKTQRDIIYSGRSILSDLVDSSVPDTVSVNDKSITLKNLCEKIIKSLGIKSKVVNIAGVIDKFTSKEIKAVGFGGKAGEFLQSFAKKRGVFLISDGNGDLLIYSPSQEINNSKKLTDISMLDRSAVYDDSQRYNTIRVGSQDNSSISSGFGSDSVIRSQSAVDPEVRGTRYLELNAQESMTNKELLRRVNEEINIRRARGFNYSCIVPNHSYNKGDLIKVEDSLIGVSGVFLVKAVTYNQSLSGNTSNLVLCYPESYSAQGKRTSKRKSKMGVGKVIETPEPIETDFLTLETEYLGNIVLDGQ